ncbi:MAG: hypothetical protein K0U98_16440 [Deltaproteobacteria bacterium]|nr:hypothetical protein [Deltaproteobacteria bacterium]
MTRPSSMSEGTLYANRFQGVPNGEVRISGTGKLVLEGIDPGAYPLSPFDQFYSQTGVVADCLGGSIEVQFGVPVGQTTVKANCPVTSSGLRV